MVVLWLTAIVLLALRWDGTLSANYASIFVPVYLALIMKWFHTLLLMQQIRQDTSKMISKDKFLSEVLQGREPEELEEEELKTLHEKYVVVSQIPADLEYELEHDDDCKDLTDEEKEEMKVTHSKEFEAAMEAQSDARRALVKSMVLDVAFLVLVVLKVDHHVESMSWWLVFLPILVAYGLRILHSCFICCCITTAMDPDEVVVMAMKKEDLENLNDLNGEGADDNIKNEEGFLLGSEVILHGLNTEAFNGKVGIVKEALKEGRQEVYIEELEKTVVSALVMRSASNMRDSLG